MPSFTADAARAALARHAQAALDVQSAVNLSGVVLSWHHACTALWAVVHAHPDRRLGTRWVNRHPISVLFAVQVAELTGGFYDRGGEDLDYYSRATRACEFLAGGGDVFDPDHQPR